MYLLLCKFVQFSFAACPFSTSNQLLAQVHMPFISLEFHWTKP